MKGRLFTALISLTQLIHALRTADRQLQNGVDMTPCYVCLRENARVRDRDTVFTDTGIQYNEETWSCGALEDHYRENYVRSSIYCQRAQEWADEHCDCPGRGPSDLYISNPACDICRYGRGVPPEKVDLLVDTGSAGEWNCGTLYTRAAEGFIPGNLCDEIHLNVGDECCESDPVPVMSPTQPPTESCADVHEECDSVNTCCPGLQCEQRNPSSPFKCSTSSRLRQRVSLAYQRGYGGARGRTYGQG